MISFFFLWGGWVWRRSRCFVVEEGDFSIKSSRELFEFMLVVFRASGRMGIVLFFVNVSFVLVLRIGGWLFIGIKVIGNRNCIWCLRFLFIIRSTRLLFSELFLLS